jgi:hypothetical protein
MADSTPGKQTPAQRRGRTLAAEIKTDAAIQWAKRNGSKWNKTWNVDGPGCPICDPLDGETVPVNKEFTGGLDGPPAHPNCECGIDLTSK